MAQPRERPLSLTPALGPEIDQQERATYGFFPAVEDFESARIQPDGSGFRADLVRARAGETHRESMRLTAGQFEAARRHAELIEMAGTPPGAIGEEEALWRAALRFASQRRYDVATPLLSDLLARHPESPHAEWIGAAAPALESLRLDLGPLLRATLRLDRGGRTELLIFSGYYGVWAGIAAPAALGADKPSEFAAGLLLGAPLSIGTAHLLTLNSAIPRGRSAMIILGGHLGTWQGIGWSRQADSNTQETIGVGLLSGLAGIAAADAFTHAVEFEEGPAEITNMAMPWGAWLGVVAGTIADHEGEELLRDALIGSDLLVLAGGMTARDVEISRTRVRLISLAGVVGTVFALGIDVLAQVDDGDTALLIAGVGSLLGVAAGTRLTREFDRGRDFSGLPSIRIPNDGPGSVEIPVVLLRATPGGSAERLSGVTSGLGVRVRF